MVTSKELADDRNELVMQIAKDFGEKLGLEPLVQDACTDMATGIRISQMVMSFSEGLRASIPLTGKILDREEIEEARADGETADAPV